MDKELYHKTLLVRKRDLIGYSWTDRLEAISYHESILFPETRHFRAYWEITYVVLPPRGLVGTKLDEKNLPDYVRVTVAQVHRVTQIIPYHHTYVFHTQPGHGFYPNGILEENLPKAGNIFLAKLEFRYCDLARGASYNLIKLDNDETEVI